MEVKIIETPLDKKLAYARIINKILECQLKLVMVRQEELMIRQAYTDAKEAMKSYRNIIISNTGEPNVEFNEETYDCEIKEN